MIDLFLSFFSSVFNILFTIIFTLVGVIIGMILYRVLTRPKNQVSYIRERDGRGQDIDIGDEGAFTFKTSSNPLLRFIKFGRAYDFIKRGRVFRRYFGKEGTAYTARLQGFKGSKKNPGKLKRVFSSFGLLLMELWGREFYSVIPEPQRKLVEDKKIFVTVDLEAGHTPSNMPEITEETVLAEADKDMAQVFAQAAKKGITSKDWFERLAWIGAGSGLTLFALLILGVIG